MTHYTFPQLLRHDFAGYNIPKFRQDLLAGLTVAAVALPLALAFGVASGANASAGLIPAILAGLIIGGLSGAPYQISGPTGAMSAVLIVLAEKHGLSGIWFAGILAGIFLLVIGVARLGRFIAFVPAPVIAGFTSGIARIIAIGQIDNFLGVQSAPAPSAALKVFGYVKAGLVPDWHALTLGAVVIIMMIFWPKPWSIRFPGSLSRIILATVVNAVFGGQSGHRRNPENSVARSTLDLRFDSLGSTTRVCRARSGDYCIGRGGEFAVRRSGEQHDRNSFAG
jgi:SulP family sulfate permease